MLDSVNSNCHILLSQAISLPLLPLHSLGNICIVYCSSDSIELGKSKQDVALRNYRSQGMMEEQTEAEVRRNSHYTFFLPPPTPPHPLPPELTSIVSVSPVILCFGQASCTSIRPTRSACCVCVWGEWGGGPLF